MVELGGINEEGGRSRKRRSSSRSRRSKSKSKEERGVNDIRKEEAEEINKIKRAGGITL